MFKISQLVFSNHLIINKQADGINFQAYFSQLSNYEVLRIYILLFQSTQQTIKSTQMTHQVSKYYENYKNKGMLISNCKRLDQVIIIEYKFYFIVNYSLINLSFISRNPQQMNSNIPPAFVCILGNDGTGKSTMCRIVSEKTKYIGVQRSMKQSSSEHVINLVKQIRQIDHLTYNYAFEDDWYNFDISHFVEVQGVKVRVFWILLTAPTDILRKRINSRLEMTKYEHEKCVEYFNVVYTEMAHFYGMHLVKSDQPIQKQLQDIINIVQNPSPILAIRNLTLNHLRQLDLQQKIQQKISEAQAEIIYDQKILPEFEKSGMNKFYFPALYDFCTPQNKKLLSARWLKNNAVRKFEQNSLILQYPSGIDKQQQQTLKLPCQQGYFFQQQTQGQSKILYKILTANPTLLTQFHQKVLILLKGTIYSHTNQCTSQISQLGKVRAKGSMIFLQMLKRNHVKHSYICINKDGIILSRKVKTNMLEIVFKKECLGTDKHSFVGIQNIGQICAKDNNYNGGIYIRFDWRNPNHYLIANRNLTLNLDPYYYIIQKIAGKQQFFKKFLSLQTIKPVGDKCITQDLISSYTNPHKIKQIAIGAYCTFQYYAHQVGLEVLDGCMMVDEGVQWIWSEINPDCLRVKSVKEREDYDKDIWRAGGSSSKDLVMKKWQLFNQIFIQYFKKHKFMDVQLSSQLLCKQIYAKQVLKQGNIRPNYSQYYREIYRGNKPRQVIATLDIINGQPILVQSSEFKQKHSNSSINQALTYLSLLPQVLLVDIDGAKAHENNNRQLISQQIRANKYVSFYGVGGGIRDIQTARKYLEIFPHIVISTNLEIIQELNENQRKRVIVELSVNDDNDVLTHSRTVNNGIKVIQKMLQLCKLGIKTISITFNSMQGKLKGLPRDQLRKIMFQVPGPIQKVIIAGGISNIDDLEYVWGFAKCVPQLGSALWKRKITIGEIYAKIVRFDEKGLVPAIIQDKFGNNLGLLYLNQQSLIKTCEQRYLYRFSRQHNRLMKKGEQSGNTQKILSMNIDCDNDSLLITVDNEHPIFCHKQTQSCFYQQVTKSTQKSLQQLQQHILASKQNGIGSGYTHKIQNNPKMAMMKIFQQAEQLSLAQNQTRKVQQCADLFAHLLMYMNSENINLQEVTSLLNKRSQIKKTKSISLKPKQNIIRIGLAAGKHTKFIFDFLESTMGVKILAHQPGKQRNYTINYQITNEEKFKKALKVQSKQTKVIFVSMKPKDLSKLMYKDYIQFGVNYSNVVQVSCQNYSVITQAPVQGLRLALIKRKGQQIDIKSWSQSNKGIIISQYPSNVVKYFTQKNIPSNYYTLTKVSGHSQGFLQDKKFSYCDAIVLSGKTIQDNQLEIQAIIKAHIKVILFSLN